jgi:hypothetical protein
LRLSGLVVQLTGSVIEKPHGLHCHAYRFSAKARLISCSKIIGRPQIGQIVSAVGGVSSAIAQHYVRSGHPTLRKIKGAKRPKLYLEWLLTCLNEQRGRFRRVN